MNLDLDKDKLIEKQSQQLAAQGQRILVLETVIDQLVEQIEGGEREEVAKSEEVSDEVLEG